MSDMERYEEMPGSAAAMATIDPARTTAQLANVEKFFKSAMRRGVHFGTIPGVDKPFLWKAGAELLAGLFNFGVRGKRDELLSFVDRAAELVEITVKATVFHRHTGRDVWDADGMASSAEACFRRRACPQCSKPVKRDQQDKGQFACTACEWRGKADQLGDALAVDFGTTIRNVAARAEKRAKVRAIAESSGVTGFFLTPQTWEQEEDAAAHVAGKGNCPKCGVGSLVERQRRDGSGSFWACDNGTYDPKTKKRTGCDHIQNDPPASTETEAQGEEGPWDDKNLPQAEAPANGDTIPAIQQQYTRLGLKTGAAIKASLVAWGKAAAMTLADPPSLTKLNDVEQQAYLGWLKEQEAAE